jgi:hypothetical protein
MLRSEPRKRHREIEPESYVPVAVISEPVDLPLHLGVDVELPEQYLAILESGGLNRREAELAKDVFGELDAPLLHDRALRKLVREPLQGARVDARRHTTNVVVAL